MDLQIHRIWTDMPSILSVVGYSILMDKQALNTWYAPIKLDSELYKITTPRQDRRVTTKIYTLI